MSKCILEGGGEDESSLANRLSLWIYEEGWVNVYERRGKCI